MKFQAWLSLKLILGILPVLSLPAHGQATPTNKQTLEAFENDVKQAHDLLGMTREQAFSRFGKPSDTDAGAITGEHPYNVWIWKATVKNSEGKAIYNGDQVCAYFDKQRVVASLASTLYLLLKLKDAKTSLQRLGLINTTADDLRFEYFNNGYPKTGDYIPGRFWSIRFKANSTETAYMYLEPKCMDFQSNQKLPIFQQWSPWLLRYESHFDPSANKEVGDWRFVKSNGSPDDVKVEAVWYGPGEVTAPDFGYFFVKPVSFAHFGPEPRWTSIDKPPVAN